MSLDDIVNVQITRQTQTVSQAGFGLLMILGTFKNWNDRIRFYSNMRQIAEDFQPEQAEYQAASAVFSQQISPPQIAIGRRQANDATVDVLTSFAGKVYTITANGIDYSITATNTNQQSKITFSADFGSDNDIDMKINGVDMTQVSWVSDQLATMNAIAAQIESQFSTVVETVEVLPDGVNPNRVLQIVSRPNETALATNVAVTGTGTPTATVVNATQAVTPAFIAADLATEINDNATDITADSSAEDGTIVLSPVVANAPFTLKVSVNFTNGPNGRLDILDAAPNTLYQVVINGTTIQYTSPTNVQTNEEIAAALTLLINDQNNATGVTASDNLDGTIALSSDDVTKILTCEFTPFIMQYVTGLIIEPLTASESVTASLNAVQAVDDTWYAVACTDHTSATQQLIAAWTEPQVKIYGTASSDANIINESVSDDNTSIAYILRNANYARSFLIYNQDADSEYPECAWFGACLPFNPGSETWAFKNLAGVAYSDLSTNQENNAHNKNCNTFEYIGGVGITLNGVVSVGEYIDVIRGIDWLTSTIQSYVYSTLVNSPKVPYTDSGITAIQAQVQRALAQGVTNQLLSDDPAPVVTVPKAANVSSADKAARILRNVNFTATLAGAIQAIQITGTVTV